MLPVNPAMQARQFVPVDLKIPPGSEVKAMIKCGSCTLYFFQSSTNNLRGICIEGDGAQEEELCSELRRLIELHGPIDQLLSHPKYDGLREKFLLQAAPESKTLDGRSVVHQKVESDHEVRQTRTTRSTDSPFNSPLHSQLASYGGIALQTFLSSGAQFAAQDRISQLEKEIQDTKAKGRELANELDNKNPQGVNWYEGYKGNVLPIRGRLDSIIESGDLEGLDKLLPGVFTNLKEPPKIFYRGPLDYSWIPSGSGGDEVIYVHPITGISLLKRDLPQVFKIRESIQKHQDVQQKLNGMKARSRFLEQHAPWDQSLAHLEVLAGLWNKDTAHIVLRQARLGNQLVEKLRVLQFRLDQFNEMRKKDGFLTAAWSIGASISTLEPLLACMALGASICAIVGSSGNEMLPPLTQQTFFQVINQSLFPLIQDVHLSLSNGQSRLADQTDEQTTALLQAMNLCQKELIELLARLKGETNQHFETKKFEDFVTAVRRNARAYREDKLADAVAFIKGTRVPPDGWLQRYLESTEAALAHSKTNDAHGFIGSKSPSMECAAQSGVSMFSTGGIHHALFGNQLFPPELSLLDAACHTYICLVRALLQNQQMMKSKESTGLLLLAERLLEGIENQSRIFNGLGLTLNLLLESHEAFMMRLENNIRASKVAKAGAQDKTRQWVMDSRAAIIEATIGQEMFGLSKFAFMPMNLTPYSDEIQSTLNGRQYLNSLTFPPILFFRWKQGDSWSKTTSVMDRKVCELPMACKLTDKIFTGEALKAQEYCHKANASLKRRIWWDKNGFQSAVSVSAMSRIPFAYTWGHMDELSVIDNPPVPPKNPLLDCTVLLQVKEAWDGNLKTEFDQDSRLQMEDLQKIPRVDESCGAQRKNLMAGVLDLLEGGNLPEEHPLRKYSDRYEVCLPLQKGATPLPLPKTLMAYMQHALCPDLEKMALTGSSVDLRYDFEKSRLGDVYRLNLHAVYDESQVPFQSRCIFEVDAATVESYAKQMEEGATPNITEFLYSALFAGDYEGEGLPGAKTHVNEKKGIIAPSLTAFPGLFRILEKCPHLCFSFNHRQYSEYTDATFNSLIRFLDGNQFNERAKKFFKVGQTQVNAQNYMAVQKRMREKASSIESSVEVQTFKRNYTLFQTLAQLVSADNPNAVREKLMAFARIIPPGEMGWLEQAYYYDPPSKEACRRLLTELGNNPSLAQQRLEKHAGKLRDIRSVLQRIENGESFSLEEQMRWVEYKSGLNEPSKLLANLEEDAK